jgi:hypothetical protein
MMEEWINLHVLFVKYSSDKASISDDRTPQQVGQRQMSSFQVKCALVALFGSEVSSVRLI